MEFTEPAIYSIERVERDYYAALFRRDYGEAQRLYRELARTPYWSANRLVREAHKCGLYDAADRDEDAVVTVTVTVAAAGAAVRQQAVL